MPLIGLTDEKGKNWTFEQVAKGKGTFSDPRSVLLHSFSDRDNYCDFSMTQLMDDPYFVQMRMRYDYFESVDDLIDRLLGTMLHGMMDESSKRLQKLDAKVRSEMTLVTDMKVKIKGKEVVVKVGGKTDLLEIPVLWDYKTATIGKLRFMAAGKTSDGTTKYEEQLNGYRYLMSIVEPKLASQIKELKIRFIVRDWRRYEFIKADRDTRKYPRGAILDVPMWTIEDTAKWFKARVVSHITASRVRDEDLHEVGECDTWKDHMRCTDYCQMKDVCHFRRSDVAVSKPATKMATSKQKGR